MKKEDWKTRKQAKEQRDKTRDKTGVKAQRRNARNAKNKRRDFERVDWQ